MLRKLTEETIPAGFSGWVLTIILFFSGYFLIPPVSAHSGNNIDILAISKNMPEVKPYCDVFQEKNEHQTNLFIEPDIKTEFFGIRTVLKTITLNHLLLTQKKYHRKIDCSIPTPWFICYPDVASHLRV